MQVSNLNRLKFPLIFLCYFSLHGVTKLPISQQSYQFKNANVKRSRVLHNIHILCLKPMFLILLARCSLHFSSIEGSDTSNNCSGVYN